MGAADRRGSAQHGPLARRGGLGSASLQRVCTHPEMASARDLRLESQSTTYPYRSCHGLDWQRGTEGHLGQQHIVPAICT